MGNLEEKLNTGSDYLKRASDAVKYGKEFASYWNPIDNTKRVRADLEIRELVKKKKRMIFRYMIIWLVLIGSTIAICIRR